LAKIIETWWMLCHPLESTSEPIITTLGPKPCTFQNSFEFRPNSQNLVLFLFFSSPSLANQPRDPNFSQPSKPSPSAL
jgi:hypothetical protein